MASLPYDQDDILNAFGTVGGECAITGDTDDLTQAHLPYYVVPYLDGTPETYTSIPRFPYVIPDLKLTVTTNLYDEHECLRNPPAIKRREPGTYVID